MLLKTQFVNTWSHAVTIGRIKERFIRFKLEDMFNSAVTDRRYSHRPLQIHQPWAASVPDGLPAPIWEPFPKSINSPPPPRSCHLGEKQKLSRLLLSRLRFRFSLGRYSSEPNFRFGFVLQYHLKSLCLFIYFWFNLCEWNLI